MRQLSFTERMGATNPIVQAPMILQNSLVPLAAAVSNAGALRSLECAEMSRLFSGWPCRARHTEYSAPLAAGRPELLAFPLMYNYSSPLKRYGIIQEDLEHQFLLCGQAAALNDDLIGAT
jgi:hypothetical protein